MATTEDELRTVQEVAQRYRKRDETVRRWITRGHLAAQTLPSGQYLIRESDLAKFLRPIGATDGK